MEDIDYKKSLGQNFIYDTNLLNAIAKDGGVVSSDTILEIGAGAGTLTSVLSKNAKKVISFEIDKSLIPILEKVRQENENIEFHFEDFMQCDLKEILKNEKVKVVANIPYYITTPIVFKLVDEIDQIKSILILVQKEVAERFAANERTKSYGITSVILQSLFDVSMPRIIKKECFTPSPKVDSALCLLVPNKKFNFDNFDNFKNFVHKSFAMRRKTLVNNLIKSFDISKLQILDLLHKFGFSDSVRPEEISVENFVNLYKVFSNLKS